MKSSELLKNVCEILQPLFLQRALGAMTLNVSLRLLTLNLCCLLRRLIAPKKYKKLIKENSEIKLKNSQKLPSTTISLLNNVGKSLSTSQKLKRNKYIIEETRYWMKRKKIEEESDFVQD